MSEVYGRDEVIADIAKVIAGLQMPVSLGTNLGTAREPWDRLFVKLHTFGWTDADQLEKELRAILGEHPSTSPRERNFVLWAGDPDGDDWIGPMVVGRYSSVASVKRGIRRWREKHPGAETYIQYPGEPDPTKRVVDD